MARLSDKSPAPDLQAGGARAEKHANVHRDELHAASEDARAAFRLLNGLPEHSVKFRRALNLYLFATHHYTSLLFVAEARQRETVRIQVEARAKMAEDSLAAN